MTEATSGASTCATHPGQPAFVDCARCGAPACSYCLEQEPGDLCGQCVEREEGGGVIAFERRDLDWPRRFGRTVRDVLARPSATFGRLGRGSVALSLLYVGLIYLLTNLGMLAVLAPLMLLSAVGWQTPLGAEQVTALPMLVGAACGGPPMQALLGIGFAMVLGGLYHASAKAVGGRGSFESSVRASAYALTVVLLWAPLTVGLLLPVVGAVVLGIAFVGQLLFLANALTAAGEGAHELDDRRARIAGWLPSGILLFVVALAVGVGLWVAEATEPSRAPDVYAPAAPDDPWRGPTDF